MFEQNFGGDPISYFKKEYGIHLKPLSECRKIIMKSPNKKVEIEGKLGYFIPRGMQGYSIEKQMSGELEQVAIHYQRPASCMELSHEYDFVVVADGKDIVARELGVWEDIGKVYIKGAIAVGSYDVNSSIIYFNNDYAGHGYARVTPWTPTHALIGLYGIGIREDELDIKFKSFIKQEGLDHLEYIYTITPPAFSTGRVKKFQVDNILLAGRAAGLTDRLLGMGGTSSIQSGIYAAQAMINSLDYNKLVSPLRDHLENISAFREPFNKLDNNGYDKLISAIGTPGIKQMIYNSGINFTDFAGEILKRVYH